MLFPRSTALAPVPPPFRLRSRGAPVLVCLLLLTLTACTDTRKPIRDGDLLVTNGEFAKAIEMYQSVINQTPNGGLVVKEAHDKIRRAYLLWAQNQFTQRSFLDASKTADAYLASYPDGTEAVQLRNLRLSAFLEHGRAVAEHESPVEAVRYLKRVVAEGGDGTVVAHARETLSQLGTFYLLGQQQDRRGLFCCNIDGSGLRFLAPALQAALSPDGTTALVIQGEPGATTGKLAKVNLADGATEEIFSTTVCTHPSWFPEGGRFVVTKISDPNLFQIIGQDGSKTNVYANTFLVGKNAAVDVLGAPSPDGSRLVGWQTRANGAVVEGTGAKGYSLVLLSAALDSFQVVATLPALPASVFWLNKGEKVGWTEGTEVKALPVGGGLTQTVVRVPEGQITAYAPAPHFPHQAVLVEQNGTTSLRLFDRREQLHPVTGLPSDLRILPGMVDWRPGYLP